MFWGNPAANATNNATSYYSLRGWQASNAGMASAAGAYDVFPEGAWVYGLTISSNSNPGTAGSGKSYTATLYTQAGGAQNLSVILLNTATSAYDTSGATRQSPHAVHLSAQTLACIQVTVSGTNPTAIPISGQLLISPDTPGDLFLFNSDGNSSPTTITNPCYVPFSGYPGCGGTENQSYFPAPLASGATSGTAGTFKNVCTWLSVAQGATVTWSLRENGVTKTPVATFASTDTGVKCDPNGSTDYFTATAGNNYDILHSGASVATDWSVGVVFAPAVPGSDVFVGSRMGAISTGSYWELVQGRTGTPSNLIQTSSEFQNGVAGVTANQKLCQAVYVWFQSAITGGTYNLALQNNGSSTNFFTTLSASGVSGSGGQSLMIPAGNTMNFYTTRNSSPTEPTNWNIVLLCYSPPAADLLGF
jgi:hypothetical protein